MYQKLSKLLNFNVESIDDVSDSNLDHLENNLKNKTNELSDEQIQSIRGVNQELYELLVDIKEINDCINFMYNEGF